MVTVLLIKEALIVYNILVGTLFWFYQHDCRQRLNRIIRCFVVIKFLNSFELLASIFASSTIRGFGDSIHIVIVFFYSYGLHIWVSQTDARRHEYGVLFAYTLCVAHAFRFLEEVPYYSTIVSTVTFASWLLLSLVLSVFDGTLRDMRPKTDSDLELTEIGTPQKQRDSATCDKEKLEMRPSLPEVLFVYLYSVLFLTLGTIDVVTYVKANDTAPLDLFSLGLDSVAFTIIPLFMFEFSYRAMKRSAVGRTVDNNTDSDYLNTLTAEDENKICSADIQRREKTKEDIRFEQYLSE